MHLPISNRVSIANLFATMALIRAVEQTLLDLFDMGLLHGFLPRKETTEVWPLCLLSGIVKS